MMFYSYGPFHVPLLSSLLKPCMRQLLLHEWCLESIIFMAFPYSFLIAAIVETLHETLTIHIANNSYILTIYIYIYHCKKWILILTIISGYLSFMLLSRSLAWENLIFWIPNCKQFNEFFQEHNADESKPKDTQYTKLTTMHVICLNQ